MTVNEAAAAARVSRPTMYRYWALGMGPRYSQVGSRRLIKESWLNDWLLEQEAA